MQHVESIHEISMAHTTKASFVWTKITASSCFFATSLWLFMPALVIALDQNTSHDLAASQELDASPASGASQTTLTFAQANILIPASTPTHIDNWFEKMQRDASASGYQLITGKVEENTHAIIEYTNFQYASTAEAAGHVMASAAEHLPAEVDQVTLVVNESGLYPIRITYPRPVVENLELRESDPAIALSYIDILPGRQLEDPDFYGKSRRKLHEFDAGLVSEIGIVDTDAPLLYQIFAAANAKLDLARGWSLNGQLRLDLVDNYDDFSPSPVEGLPQVRSNISEFISSGQLGIDHLYAQKRGQISPDLYYQAFAGILELQYSGVGAEVLYYPFRSRIGIGANLIAVQQRDFAGGLGTRDFETTIGQLSGYWASPIYDLDFAIHAGRYLAGDLGGTIEVARTFSNGWSVGLSATATDARSEAFRANGFNAAVTLDIPLRVLSFGKSRKKNNLFLKPVSGDGGARLDDFGTELWQSLKPTRHDVLTQTEGQLLR